MTISRKTPLLAAGALALSLTLAACQGMQNNPKQSAGTVLGGVGGAVAGAQFGSGTGQLAATAAGTLLGAWLGSEVGASLDRADREYAMRAQQQAYTAPIGETIRWDNPQTGHSGTYTPIRAGTTQTGAYCRQFQTTVNIDGRRESAIGTACQQADGTWKIVES